MSTKLQTYMAPGVRRDPFAMLRRMTREFDRMFEGSPWQTPEWPFLTTKSEFEKKTWLPRVDVFEREGRLVTRVDLPGMKKDDVKVEIVEGYLTIAGERKMEVEEKKDDFYYSEREFGTFYRAVPLPDGIHADDVKASFANGVLEISLPLPLKTPAPRKVEIEEEEKVLQPA
jgi:HSP20 family protein